MPVFARKKRFHPKIPPNSKNATSPRSTNSTVLNSFRVVISASVLFCVIINNISKVSDESSNIIRISIPSPSLDLCNNATRTAVESYTNMKKDAASIFLHSSSCAHAAQTEQKCCIIYFPYVDLRDHLEYEEALQKHNQSPTQGGASLLFLQNLTQHRAILTRCGYKGGDIESQVNQDRAIIVSPFLFKGKGSIKMTGYTASSLDFLMGVFDGHGESGHVIAQHAAQTLPNELAKQLELAGSNDESYIKNAFIQSFIKVDAAIPQNITNSGCTASLILRVQSKVYVANVGDSQSYIASYHKKTKIVQIVYITRKDKPDLDDERKRIEAAGGAVYIPPKPNPQKLSSRVRVIGLAMSRCIGDLDGKALGIIAEPIVDVLDIDSLKIAASTPNNESLQSYSSNGDDVELFAISASDGLHDYITPLIVAQFLATSLYQEEGTDAEGVMRACEQLIQQSSKLWNEDEDGYRDDITIAVTKIQPK